MTRYVAAYANEIKAFVAALGGETRDIPVGRDGLNALIAEAALVGAHWQGSSNNR